MISPKPYLIRAVIEWSNNNQLTPHVLVHTNIKGVTVPKDFIQDDRIIFDVADDAVRDLVVSDHWVTFQAQFQGVWNDVVFPVQAIGGVFAKENGQGAYFDPDEDEPPEGPPPSSKDGDDLFTVIK